MSHRASEQVEATSLILEPPFVLFLAPRCANKLPLPLHWLPISIKEQSVVAIDELNLHHSHAQQVLHIYYVHHIVAG